MHPSRQQLAIKSVTVVHFTVRVRGRGIGREQKRSKRRIGNGGRCDQRRIFWGVFEAYGQRGSNSRVEHISPRNRDILNKAKRGIHRVSNSDINEERRGVERCQNSQRLRYPPCGLQKSQYENDRKVSTNDMRERKSTSACCIIKRDSVCHYSYCTMNRKLRREVERSGLLEV